MNRSIASIAIVIPVYNEEEALPTLFAALRAFKENQSRALSVVFVDDHSSDGTSNMLLTACRETPWFKYIRTSRRVGSHAAIIAGLDHSDEDCAVFIAADLQDPLELIGQMVGSCEEKYDIVWANRNGRDRQGWFEHVSSHLFYRMMTKFSNIPGIPFQASFAVLSRRAYKNLVRNVGARVSLVVEIPSLGYPVASIPFSKPKRMHGQSKWSLSRKILALMDAVVASSFVPLRLMIYGGMTISVLGAIYALLILIFTLAGIVKLSGWASLMIVVLILGGMQMAMIGVIGEYLWRISENTSKRVPYLIEESYNVPVEDES